MIPRFSPLLFALFIGSACQSQPAAPAAAERLEIRQQWTGQHGGGDLAGVRALRTSDEWKAFWQQAEREPPGAPDFTRHMAVIIALGEKRTGGFGVEVIRIRPDRGKLVVEYRETTPPPGMMVTQALTSPWAVVVVARSEFPVVGRSVAAPKPQEK